MYTPHAFEYKMNVLCRSKATETNETITQYNKHNVVRLIAPQSPTPLSLSSEWKVSTFEELSKILFSSEKRFLLMAFK